MENKSYRQAFVYVQNKYAGIIKETETGYSFQYSQNYLNSENPLPVSLTLPLQQNEFTSNILFPFFDGLIPEGWLLNIAIKNWKLSNTDRFGLLISVCTDCIGDVSILRELK